MLYIPALFLSLSVIPPGGAEPLPGTTASRCSTCPAISGGASPVSSNAIHAEPRESSGSLQANRTHARFGTQKLVYQSLIHHDQDRPGAVAEWRPGLQTDVRGFVFHPDIRHGPRELAEGSDTEHQLLGVVGEHTLPFRDGDTLTLNGGLVAGNELAIPLANGATIPGTRAWSLGADVSLLESRLQLSLEQAGSGRDRGGIWVTAGSHAEASRLAAEWHADRSRAMRWHAGAEYSRVGPGFDSAANPELKADRERLRSHGGFSIEDWRLRVSAEREHDNLLGDPIKPTEEKVRYRSIITWTPSDIGNSSLFGRPQFQVDVEFGENQRVPAPGNTPEASAYSRLQLESEFRSGAGRWGVRAARSRTPGAIDSSQRAGIDIAQFELYRDQRSFKVFPVRSQLRWQQRQDLVTGTTQDRWQAFFGSKTIAMHERLSADVDLRYHYQTQSNVGAPQEDLKLAGRLVWTVDRATATRGGVVLALNADYGDRLFPASSDEGGYRLLLVLSNTNAFDDW